MSNTGGYGSTELGAAYQGYHSYRELLRKSLADIEYYSGKIAESAAKITKLGGEV